MHAMVIEHGLGMATLAGLKPCTREHGSPQHMAPLCG